MHLASWLQGLLMVLFHILLLVYKQPGSGGCHGMLERHSNKRRNGFTILRYRSTLAKLFLSDLHLSGITMTSPSCYRAVSFSPPLMLSWIAISHTIPFVLTCGALSKMVSEAFEKLANTLQISRSYHVKPAGIRWRSNTIFITATVAVGLFTDMFLYGLIGV